MNDDFVVHLIGRKQQTGFYLIGHYCFPARVHHRPEGSNVPRIEVTAALVLVSGRPLSFRQTCFQEG
jgi:hypothetical protein